MALLTAMEKLWFPGFVLFLQATMLVLFGVLVEYDEFGAPVESEDPPDSVDTIRTFYPLFQDVHVMIFVGFGFLMTFLRRYGYSSIGFNLLLAALVLQWGTLTTGLFGFIDISDQRDELPDDQDPPFKIKVGLQSMIGADFTAAAVLITFGAVLGRASPFQMIIIAFMECIFYSANEALNINVIKAADAGGSMLIHTFGAYFGLAVSVILYRKRATDHPRNSSSYHSDLFAMIGTLFLWLFWPSFNGALVTGDARYRAFVNTYFSLSGSVLMSYVVSMCVDPKKKLDMVHIQNATLAGGVAVGACADMVIEPWGALLIGCFSGILSVLGYTFLSPIMDKWLYLQDTCGVHNLHGLPGVMSGIAATIAASLARKTETDDRHVVYGDSLYVVFAARAPESINGTDCGLTDTEIALGVECGDGRSAPEQAGYQLALLASTLCIAIIGGLITGLIASFPLFQRTYVKDFFDDESQWNSVYSLYRVDGLLWYFVTAFALADDADNYLPPEDNGDDRENEEPPVARDDRQGVHEFPPVELLFPAKGKPPPGRSKGATRDDVASPSSITSGELETNL